MIDKIKQIQYSRLKDEEKFFLDTIYGIESFRSDKHPESIFWVKNGNVLLECNCSEKWIYVNYDLIWGYLEFKYRYKYVDIKPFIKNILKVYTNLGLLEPYELYTVPVSTLERHLNIESFEPKIFMDSDIFQLKDMKIKKI